MVIISVYQLYDYVVFVQHPIFCDIRTLSEQISLQVLIRENVSDQEPGIASKHELGARE